MAEEDRKSKAGPAGVSSTSLDSGFPQNESSQSLVAPSGKPSVRIMEPASKTDVKNDDSDSVLGESKDKKDIEEIEFESNATLRDFQIEVSEQLVERCATQLSTNERIVGGRRSHNSANLGTVRHLAVVKNEWVETMVTL